MSNATTSKINIKDVILYILVIISLGLNIFVLLKVGDFKAELLILNAKESYRNHVRFECQKDLASENCERELKRTEEDIKNYLQTL